MTRLKIYHMALPIIHNVFFYLLLFTYAYFFVYYIVWDDFKDFNDISNYIRRIEYLETSGKERVYTGLSLLSSEILWKNLLVKISSLDYRVISYRESLLFLSFVSLSIYARFVFKRVHILIGALLLFNPMFVQLIMEQIRIALAFALLLVAFEIKSSKFAYLFMLAAIFIHTVSLLLIAICVALKLLGNIAHHRSYYLYSLLFAFVLAIFLKFGVDVILSVMGDRRIGYAMESSSIKYSAFWFLVSLILVLKAKVTDAESNLMIAFSIVMMGIFFFSSLMGAYGQRYVAISIPLIIVSIDYLPTNYKYVTFFVFWLYGIMNWFYWFKVFLV